MRVCGLAVIGMCALIAGCPFTVIPDNPAAVLEGTWSVTPEDPGDFADWEFEATFDSQGDLTQLHAAGPEGETVTRNIDGTTTEVDGNDVTITVPNLTDTGVTVFEGTLSEDQNTMTGSTTEEIDLGDLEVVVPGGALTLERIPS